mmetsp:Transcript_22235/g.55588  ORF Transcript_22235/g.55588 Transcript_22235/m.55588 type:complete len:300 (-) Transcript_22235:825-1724(-)
MPIISRPSTQTVACKLHRRSLARSGATPSAGLRHSLASRGGGMSGRGLEDLPRRLQECLSGGQGLPGDFTLCPRSLAFVLPPPELRRGAGKGSCRPSGDLLCCHGPSLQLQRALRSFRQASVVGGIGRAEVALGLDMQPHELSDLLWESAAAKEPVADLLVPLVRHQEVITTGVLVEEQVPDVVQERSDHRVQVRTMPLGHKRCHQSVLLLSGESVVARCAPLLEEVRDLLHHRSTCPSCGGQVGPGSQGNVRSTLTGANKLALEVTDHGKPSMLHAGSFVAVVLAPQISEALLVVSQI